MVVETAAVGLVFACFFKRDQSYFESPEILNKEPNILSKALLGTKYNPTLLIIQMVFFKNVALILL